MQCVSILYSTVHGQVKKNSQGVGWLTVFWLGGCMVDSILESANRVPRVLLVHAKNTIARTHPTPREFFFTCPRTVLYVINLKFCVQCTSECVHVCVCVLCMCACGVVGRGLLCCSTHPPPQVNLCHGIPPNGLLETCTAGAGTLTLEFSLLSRLLGDPVYESVARRAVRALWDHRSQHTGLVGRLQLEHSCC